MNQNLWKTPVTLYGQRVSLEPLNKEDIPGLLRAGKDPGIWRYMVYGNLSEPSNMNAWVNELLEKQIEGTDLPFTVRLLSNREIVGATRYLEMRPGHHSLEVGGTWYAVKYQRTFVNTESKYLLLKYAFETLGCARVQFKADARNQNSLRAIERLGAVKEGVLRNHYTLHDGTLRDSVFFSILDREWEDVKKGLEDKLDSR